jgi:hypothetical protein
MCVFNSNGSLGPGGGRHSGQALQQLLSTVYFQLWDIETSQVSKIVFGTVLQNSSALRGFLPNTSSKYWTHVVKESDAQ